MLFYHDIQFLSSSSKMRIFLAVAIVTLFVSASEASSIYRKAAIKTEGNNAKVLVRRDQTSQSSSTTGNPSNFGDQLTQSGQTGNIYGSSQVGLDEQESMVGYGGSQYNVGVQNDYDNTLAQQTTQNKQQNARDKDFQNQGQQQTQEQGGRNFPRQGQQQDNIYFQRQAQDQIQRQGGRNSLGQVQEQIQQQTQRQGGRYYQNQAQDQIQKQDGRNFQG